MNGNQIPKKPVRERRRGHRGSAMLVMLVAITVAGIIGSQLAERTEIRDTRNREELLRHTLARIRSAFDMKFRLDATYDPDLSTPAAIQQALQDLVRDRLLGREELRDPLIPASLWGMNTENYWKSVGNVSVNSSFESDVAPDLTKSEVVASWSTGDITTSAASDSLFTPSRFSGAFDDYLNQNKLGRPMTASGTSLRIDN